MKFSSRSSQKVPVINKVDDMYPVRMTNERNTLYYKKRDKSRNLIVSLNLTNLTGPKISPTIHPLENEILIDFKLIDGALLYMLVTYEDNFYKFHLRNLKKGLPSFEFFNAFPRRQIL